MTAVGWVGSQCLFRMTVVGLVWSQSLLRLPIVGRLESQCLKDDRSRPGSESMSNLNHRNRLGMEQYLFRMTTVSRVGSQCLFRMTVVG